MAKELEYFKEFLENPSSYIAREFYELVGEWADYIIAHKNEFNYLEDEQWREIRERLRAAYQIKEDLRLEFEEIEERLDSLTDEVSDDETIAVYNEWLEFMKRTRTEYGFTDEQIAEAEARLEQLVESVRKCEIAEENLRKSTVEYEKSLEEMDEALAEHYVRTGRRLVLTSLKRRNGN